MFKRLDIVQVGKGKARWVITGRENGYVNLVATGSNATRRGVSIEHLTLIESGPESVATQTGTSTEPEAALQGTVASAEPEHIRGESPAEYQARTGFKLDGRRTSFGRAILAALQLPKFRATPKKIKAARRKARRA